ncbi:MAG TPA: sugar ABC transporter substrate-binding protein, partial [Roseiflexaceae bacterium]|nr:sugar ABC transporter substrate-binding protein [Roseiflexaceae bacterium]
MKPLKLFGLLLVAALALAACGGATPSAPAPTAAPAAAPTAAPAAAMDPKDVKILVSMKGPGGGNPFWAAVEKGATEAGQALGVQVSVLAPPS